MSMIESGIELNGKVRKGRNMGHNLDQKPRGNLAQNKIGVIGM